MSRDTDELTPVETAQDAQATQVETNPVPEQAPATDTSTTTDATQAPATPAAKTPEELAAEKEAAEKAMTDFQAAAKAAVDSADPATADLTQEAVDAVKAAYVALDSGSPRTTAKRWIDDQMKAEIGQVRVVQAKAYMTLGESIKSHSTRDTVVVPPVDPTTAHVERVASLYISANLVLPGEGVATDWSTQVQKLAASLAPEITAYRNYLTALAAYEADTRPAEVPEGTPEGTVIDVKGAAPTEPEVSSVVKTAAKIAQGRPASVRKGRTPKSASATGTPAVRSPRTGERRDIKAHIDEVFASKPVGTFMKFGEIAKIATSVAPAGDTSQGAVSSRVKGNNWTSTSLVYAEDGGVQGVRKVA
jgi:hypothetical protein